MKESMLLTIDAIINLALGVLLVTFPAPLVEVLGMPDAPGFYPNILGGVLIGIGIALLTERGSQGRHSSGLGLNGAIAINLCGGLVLAGWLTFGELAIPLRGYILLWGLVILLLGVSFAELFARARIDGGVAT